MTSVTLKKAIELTGKSKRTIQRYMSNGKLSYTTNVDGHKVIDVSELIRVFGELSPPVTSEVRPSVTPDLSPLGNVDIADQIAKAIVEAQAPLLKQIAELVGQVENLANRLEHKPSEPEPEPKLEPELRYPDKPKPKSYLDGLGFGER